MNPLFIPSEEDFRRWIKEAVNEAIGNLSNTLSGMAESQNEPLLSRKEIADIFRISLVTLHDWMNKGLPFQKQGGRVYFFRSEVIKYIRQKRKMSF